MLKHGEANPLAVFGLRQLEHCPPHFHPVQFSLNVSQKVITDWIWTNLEGRFYIGDDYRYSQDSPGLTMSKVAAFELPAEASYFALILDTINQSDSDLVF
jgi:hypothetical protein